MRAVKGSHESSWYRIFAAARRIGLTNSISASSRSRHSSQTNRSSNHWCEVMHSQYLTPMFNVLPGRWDGFQTPRRDDAGHCGGCEGRGGSPYSVAPVISLGAGVAWTSATAFLVAARFCVTLAEAVRPARFSGAFFADGFGGAGALAVFLAFLAAAHLALCAATIWARPSGLNFQFFATRAAAAGEEAVGPT